MKTTTPNVLRNMPKWVEAKFASANKSKSDTPGIARAKLSTRRHDDPTEHLQAKSPHRADYRLHMRNEAVAGLLSIHVAEPLRDGPHSKWDPSAGCTPATQRHTRGDQRTSLLSATTLRTTLQN